MNLKKILPVVATIGALAFAGAASAYPTFTVNTGTYTPNPVTFQADKMTGNYTEVITLNLDGTFNFSLLWQAGQFSSNNGTTLVTSGLGATYNLYATFTGGGTYTLNSSGNVSGFTLASGGVLNMYLDKGAFLTPGQTTFTNPTVGGGAFTTTNAGDDVLIATGSGVSGAANFIGADSFNGGGFGQTTSFALNAAGSSFFTAPNPFYSLSFESGQLNTGFTVNGPLTTTQNGSLDVIFNIPEPSSLALIGLALVGLGGVARRRQKQL